MVYSKVAGIYIYIYIYIYYHSGPKGKRVKVVKSEKVNEVKDVNKVSVEEEKKREEVVDIDRGNREMREEVEVDMGVNPRKERENNTS